MMKSYCIDRYGRIFLLSKYIDMYMCMCDRGIQDMLKGPKYDGEFLRLMLRIKLGGIRLHQTLTNLVIPTFDIKCFKPIIFSSREVIN